MVCVRCANQDGSIATEEPILNLPLAAEPEAQLTEQAAARLMMHTQGILHKALELTAIAIQYVPQQQWLVGATTMAPRRSNSGP